MGKILDFFTKAKADEQKAKQAAILRFQKVQAEQQKVDSFIENHPTLIAYTLISAIVLVVLLTLKACA